MYNIENQTTVKFKLYILLYKNESFISKNKSHIQNYFNPCIWNNQVLQMLGWFKGNLSVNKMEISEFNEHISPFVD